MNFGVRTPMGAMHRRVEQTFELELTPFTLEGGARLTRHVVRGVSYGREDAPCVVVVPALTGDCRAAGVGGFWEPLIGPGRALDTRRWRVVCCDLLGSSHGSSGPTDPAFPRATEDHEREVAAGTGKGAFALPRALLPATVTTWDQARSLQLTLDALRIERVHLVVGGSLGGMIAMALAASDARVERALPLGGSLAASAWILAFNHVARRVIVDALVRGDAASGLSLARQLAMIGYRTPSALAAAQGRTQVQKSAWNPSTPYRVQTWLENHGARLCERFDARAYLCLLGAMDHHDLLRVSPTGHSLATLRARVLAVALEGDQLFVPEENARLARALCAQQSEVEEQWVRSPHGHDALFLAWDPLAQMLHRALAWT